MQLFIKTLTGETITIEADVNDTWRDIKNKIFARKGISIDSQKLIYSHTEMEDKERLFDDATKNRPYGTIHLVFRPQPQSAPNYIELPNEIKAEISIFSRKERLTLGHKDTQSYYEQLPTRDKLRLLEHIKKSIQISSGLTSFSLFTKGDELKSFEQLSADQQKIITELTIVTRQIFGGISASDYYTQIDTIQKIKLLQQCAENKHKELGLEL